MILLSHESSNHKLKKNQSDDWESFILYLAPADSVPGFNACPAASPGCKGACLYTAGHGAFKSVQAARIRKTELLRDSPDAFLYLLACDLTAALRTSTKRLAVRLNGTSDVAWETMPLNWQGKRYESIMHAFPTIVFYDYTKRADRALSALPPNYSLTFSRSESNGALVRRMLAAGVNVAVVFDKALPAEYQGARVIDGTATDMRWLDPKGVIVGLLALGKARRDDSGFVVKSEIYKKTQGSRAVAPSSKKIKELQNA